MHLNYDVLFLIMDFLDRRTLLAYMSTCHTIRRMGVRLLLHNPIYFGKRLRLKSFCQFILGDFPHRLRFLREVEFSPRFWLRKRDMIALLAKVLKHATSLEKVSIKCAERFFKIDPSLGEALANSTSVRDLHLDGVGAEALSVLTRMRSPLQSVDVFVDDNAVETYPDPSRVLARFAPSLRDDSLLQGDE